MKKNILLDRSYALFLVNYLNQMEQGRKPSLMTSAPADSSMLQALNTISWASILFDKILIDDHYGTSLRRLIGHREWFWEIFETICPDKILIDDLELGPAVKQSVAGDLKDKEIRAIVRKHFTRWYQSDKEREGLLLNINKTLEVARTLDAAILPAPDKAHIYQYKFRNTLALDAPNFGEKVSVYNALRELLSIQAPSFSCDSLEDLTRARGDSRIRALRDKVWSLAGLAGGQSPDAIRRQIEADKDKLIDILRPDPSVLSVLKMLVSELLEFPFSMLTEGYSLWREHKKVKPYQWYFLLVDLNKEGK